jgi:hypothetical protein
VLYATARHGEAAVILGLKSEQAALLFTPIKQGAKGCGDFAIFSTKMRWHLLLALLLLPAARGKILLREYLNLISFCGNYKIIM